MMRPSLSQASRRRFVWWYGERADGRRYYDHFERSEGDPAPGDAQSVGQLQDSSGAVRAEAQRDDSTTRRDDDTALSEAEPTAERGAAHSRRIQTAIAEVLEGTENAPRVEVMDAAESLDATELARLPTSGRLSGIQGLYDPANDTVLLFAGALDSAEQAAWVTFHEIAGHRGIRETARRMGVDLGTTLDRASQNSTVKAGAAAFGRQRRIRDPQRRIEEALAELAAATRTGNWQQIQDRYGVTVPQAQRNTVRAAIARLIDRIRRWRSVALRGC